MPTNQVQIRRDTATNINAATPVAGELGYDSTNKRLVVGDGSTPGGIKLPNAGDLQKQAMTYGTVGGSASAITITNSPEVSAYTNGLKLSFKATATNTSSVTVNVDSLGTKSIYKLSGTSLIALSGNEIVSGAVYDITYDGTQFQLTNGAGGSLTITQQVITSSSTYTPSVNMKYCRVIIKGGGGGSGGCNSVNHGSGGGGEGGFCEKVFAASDIGASQAVTIGAAGAAGTIGGGTGGTGGNTTFGSLMTANGGIGGTGASSAGAKAGGTGGSGSGGVIVIRGQGGSPGLGTGASGIAIGGLGGGALYATGGRGAASPGSANTGNGYGAGGGGCASNEAGAAGTSGVCIIEEYT